MGKFTDEDIAELMGNDTFMAAVTQRVSGNDEFKKALQGASKDHVGRAMKGLSIEDQIAKAVEARMAALKPAEGADAEPADPKDPGAKWKKKFADDLKAKNEEFQSQLDAIKAEKKAAEDKVRVSTENAKLTAAMDAIKVRPGLRPALLAKLREDGKVRSDETGVYVGDDAHDAWAKAFAKTDEGRDYIEANGSGGSGTGAPKGAAGGKGAPTEDVLAAAKRFGLG